MIMLLTLSSLFVLAQEPSREMRDSSRFKGGTMRDSSFMRNMAPIGKVIGSLRDSSTREPLAYASVALIKVRDSSIAGERLLMKRVYSE